ncbi:retrovirus-related pol polyprotein from transposon TNT 1-94 [Tanacetum coccineum]
MCAEAIYRIEVCTERTDTGAEDTTEGRKQNRLRSKSWKIGEIKYRQNITCWNCNQKGHFHNLCSKLVTSRDKEVNMIGGESDDALVCCIENTIEDRIMNSGASFHATYYKEELERFKLRSGTTVEACKWLRIGMSMLAFKENVLDVRKVDIYFCKPGGLEKQKNLSFIMSVKTRKLESRSCDRPRIPEEEWRGKDTSLTHLKISRYEESPSYPKQRYYIYGLDSWSQSPGGSLDTSKGSENSGSFEDSGRSDEEDSEDGAFFEEEASRLHMYEYPPESLGLQLWMFNVKEWHNGRKRYKARLVVKGFQQKRGLHEPSYVGALNDTSTHYKSEGFQLAGQEENLECILKEILYGLIQAPRLRYLKFNSFMQKDKAKLVRILISEGSLSLLKILGTKSLVEMLTRLVMKEKLKFCAASTGLRVN